MGKREQLFALLGAGMLLLPGCGRGSETDLQKRFPDYFAYAYGEDFSLEFEERGYVDLADRDGKYAYDRYAFSYTNANGEEAKGHISVEHYADFADEAPGTEAEWYGAYARKLMYNQLQKQYETPLLETYVYPDVPGLRTLGINDNASLLPICDYDAEGAAGDAVRTLTETGKGLRFYADSLETIVQDDRLCFVAEKTLHADEDAEACRTGFQAMSEKIRALGVQNCFFLLKQKESDADDAAEHVLFYEYAMYGEVTEYDPETAPAYEYAFQYLDALCAAYPAK